MIRRTTTISLVLAATSASAEVPRVMTDIAPVHSLVARVMEGVGEPEVLLPPGASPHDYSFRPSDARRLSDADLVVWMGEGLEPWLADPIETLGSGATLELLETDGWPKRELSDAHDHGVDGDDHDHDHDEHDHADEAHDDHDHEGEDHEDHDTHAGHGHDHGDFDPHAWLDPFNAGVWLTHIAEALSEADPENAQTYAENAEAAQDDLASLISEITAQLGDPGDATFAVGHDAYGYFFDRFELTMSGAVTLSDAQAPGPARIAALKEQFAEDGTRCILVDPQSGAEWPALTIEGTDIAVKEVDPLGGGIETGPDFYPALLRDMAGKLADCLTEE
ncbi:zinc ABC transporter substrate-binding protein [Pelagovum pacificum]|uniref:High-affinity zinc uptake system protein ZnuA n=1 Tax=Pelagovum pacificum TaxID=2588711 RepID=A0A5C5GEP2_9RHOB|nr:zinc ABC transporter substrate-binding protein [Pelagovum pacificum]QQA43657.1 zinc ABC transporter substrate-binding protein [Pelagovum pacificum]TNY33208.1 hypothetical protein FHY64_08010 [Pelagovum pacificum]